MVPLASSSGSRISDFPIMKTIAIMPTLEKLSLQCLHRLKLPTCRLGSGGGFSAVHTQASQLCLQISSTPPQQHKRFCSLASLISARPKWQGPLSEILISRVLQVPSFDVQICKCLSCSLLGNHCISQVWVNCFVSVFSFIMSGDSWQEGPMHCSLCISRLVFRKSNL